jgi:nitroreductase
MDLMFAIRNRRAVREFAPQAVAREAIADAIAAATLAPSAMNLQPWLFAVVEGAERLRELSSRAKAHLTADPHPPAPVARHRDRLADPAYNLFHDAPALVIVGARDSTGQSAEDCCLAAQNLMLRAFALQLGTCWVGLARPYLDLPDSKAALGLPRDGAVVAPLAIGHPRRQPAATSRRAPEIVWPV